MSHFVGGAEPLAIEVLAVIHQRALAGDRMHDEKPGDIGVPQLAPKYMDADPAELCIDIARYSAVVKAKGTTQASRCGLPVALEIVACGRKCKAFGSTTKLSHQEVLRLAQVEEILDSSAIGFREGCAVGAVERLGLLKRSDLFIGDEKFEVAAVVIR
jgi:hypothetical protein